MNNMTYLKRFSISALLIVGMISICSSIFAQVKPLVKTSLGSTVGNVSVSADEARKLITLPLTVTDNNNVTYTIESYQFLYKKKTEMTDPNTGKKAYAFSTASDIFKTSPLPSAWTGKANNLQKDEELSFFDIQVKDDKGKKFFAPDIRLKIQ
jgi:hypothetical protein